MEPINFTVIFVPGVFVAERITSRFSFSIKLGANQASGGRNDQ